MHYRKPRSSSSRKPLHVSDVWPTWSQSQTDTTNLMFQMLMEKMGVTDIKTYFEKLLLPILVCVVIGSIAGAISTGFTGFVWGALAGVIAPAALVWLGVLISYLAVYLGAIFLAWAVIWFGFLWLFSY